jgi:hypothetical protein
VSEHVKQDFNDSATPFQVRILWALVALMVGGTIVVVVVKTRPSADTGTLEAPDHQGAPSDSVKSTGPWDQQHMEALLARAESDYRNFLKAEKSEDQASRRRYYNQAKVRLQAFMDRVNELPTDQIGDPSLIRRATELLSDLSKKARTGD